VPKKHQSVSDTISWLTFPRQAYPNFYLSAQRVRDRFDSYLGSISQFSKSAEKTGGANVSVQALFLKAGIQGGGGGDKEIVWDLDVLLARALVLRAYLSTVGELDTDARSAGVTDFVLARGPGRLLEPFDVAHNPLWNEYGISPDVVTEIADEQQRQASVGTGGGPKHEYWPAFANTDRGLVVSLLGHGSLIETDVRAYLGRDMTYCIFGQKISDWQSWTLLSPLHVWVEPYGKANWG
jgi:hypothetical protein